MSAPLSTIAVGWMRTSGAVTAVTIVRQGTSGAAPQPPIVWNMGTRRNRITERLSNQHGRAWPAVILVATTVLLCTWVIGVPRFGAPDEVAHTTKAYGTAHGQTIGAPIPSESPLIRSFDIPAGLISGGPCFAFHSEINAACAVAGDDPQIIKFGTTAATYPLPYYAVVGTAVRVLGREQSPLTYRLISTLIAAALLAAALSLLRRAAGRVAALAVVALNPMTIFIVGSTNPASFEIAGTFLLWAYLALLLTAEEVAGRRQLLLASSIAATIVVVRPVALPWVAIAFGCFLLIERRPIARERRSTIHLLFVASTPLVGAVVVSSAWSRYAGVGLTDDKYVVADSTTTMLRFALGRTAELFEQAFGWLGWLDTELPTPAYMLWIASLVLVASIVGFSRDRRTKLAAIAIGLIWVFYPVAYVVLAKTPEVWQGRYNLPLLGGLVLCAVVGMRSSPWMAQAASIAHFCAWAWVLIEVAAFYQTLRRFMVGAGASVLLRGGWQPPVNAWLLIAVNTAVACLIAWLLTRPASEQTSQPLTIQTTGNLSSP